MERDAWNKQHRQKRFQGMGFPVKKPHEYACIVLKSLFCTIGWYLFLSVQLSVQNFPTESCIASHGAGKGGICRPVRALALPPPWSAIMHINTCIRTPVGADLSRPAPIYRPSLIRIHLQKSLNPTHT